MELIERAGSLTLLQSAFENVSAGEGHCVFISGEAGIGKTSIVKAFCNEIKSRAGIYQGTCDALFTPRPLAPLYDILLQLWGHLPEIDPGITDRTEFFARIFHALHQRKGISVIIFEDIHWADEATLDVIKFLARRITQVRCLFILTYRDDEIHSRHPLRTVLGQLQAASFSRIQLFPLSMKAVEKMAVKKGYKGEDVYSITLGNPFYVNEILAGYSPGLPINIKDSILSVYNRQDQETRHVWEILSVFPSGLRVRHLEKMEPFHGEAMEQSLESGILVMKDGALFFKHELYRRTIEESLSPLVRVALNKKILLLFRESFEQSGDIEQIIHHAKNASEDELVVHYAPIAAKHAASVGAHIESSRLYLSAIEYYRGRDTSVMVGFYEAYAYECYLINQIKEAIAYTEKSLHIWQEKNDKENIGNSLRFLSRLWWFEGNRKQSESYGLQAISMLQDQPSSRVQAMAYSNMAQLKMLSDEHAECIAWGEKAIAIAKELNDEEILCHALNNVGTVQMRLETSLQEGTKLLEQSLAIALKHSYHEHVSRAYINLASKTVVLKLYDRARKYLDAGIHYSEERDLDSWTYYMLSWKARIALETGDWDQAFQVADRLLKNENHSPVIKIGALIVAATISLRKGQPGALPLMLEAKKLAFEAMELQRVIPALVALLEYEWITGEDHIEKEALDRTIELMKHSENVFGYNEFAFWLKKAGKEALPLKEIYEGSRLSTAITPLNDAELWERAGCPYEQALALFEGSDEDKKKALAIMQRLGAQAVIEKMKMEMRASGIKSIPRGLRKATQSNPALLTERELDVLQLLQEGMQNKEIAARLFISGKTVDHHISSILFKLQVKSRVKAVQEATRLGIILARMNNR